MNRDLRAANVLLLIFGALSLAMLSLPLTGKIGVLRACAAYLVNPGPYYGTQGVAKMANLPAEAVRLISGNIELREANRKLKEVKYFKVRLEALRRENDRLLRELELPPIKERRVRWVRVMRRDAVNWHRSLTIAAGSKEGVVINAPVLGLVGEVLAVVGRVTESGARTSKVLLLTDDLSSVAAYLPIHDWEGLIQGQGSSHLRMNYLPDNAKLQVGEKVYTSPTSATFGSDLLIGEITKIHDRDPFLAFQSVEVAPAIYASSLKEVMILLPVAEESS